MKIKIDRFIIEPCENAPTKFNLHQIVVKQRKGTGTFNAPNGEEYEAIIDIGYGMSLFDCIGTAISINTNDSFPKDDLITIKQYVEKFEEEKNKFKIELSECFKIKIN